MYKMYLKICHYFFNFIQGETCTQTNNKTFKFVPVSGDYNQEWLTSPVRGLGVFLLIRQRQQFLEALERNFVNGMNVTDVGNHSQRKND